MQLTVQQSTLAKCLSLTARAARRRGSAGLPILSLILFSADGDGSLTLTATDLELAIRLTCPAEIQEPGSLALPASLAGEWIKSMPDAPVHIKTAAERAAAELDCARNTATIHGYPADEFPLVPYQKGEASLALPAAVFRSLVSRVVFAASEEESRPALTGVLLTAEDGRLQMVTTDGYRLAIAAAPAAVPSGLRIIIPTRSMFEVGKIAAESDAEHPISLEWDPGKTNNLRFVIQGKSDGAFRRAELTTQLIDAKFPDYRAIIPKAHTARTLLDRTAFLQAVKVASLISRNAGDQVRIQVQPGTDTEPGCLTLRANAAEIGDSLVDLEAVVAGPGIEIAFKAEYLLDVLPVIDTAQVALETTDKLRPGVIRPVGDDSHLCVIMPMQLGK